MSQVFTGKDQINGYIAVTLMSAIRMYVLHGMKANRAYTPTNMLRKAGELTGRTFKRGQLKEAHNALAEATGSDKRL